MRPNFSVLFPLLVFLISFSSQAQGVEQTEIIFDASHSMNDSMGSGTRLSAAKQALNDFISKIDPQANVGLRVFGDTRVTSNMNSCTDSKLVVPIQSGTSQSIISYIQGVQANGLTPIGYSLQQTVNDFSKAADVKKTIILISDGEESCNVDPVAVVQGLKAQGIHVTLHAIGFAVDEKARAQLKRLAEVTGGTYADAENAEELVQELTQAAEASMLLSIQRGSGHNILAAAEGTRIVRSSTQEFAKVIDGKEDSTGAMYPGQDVVFSFKDNQAVLLEKFSVPVFKVGDYNPSKLTLSGALDSPEGPYYPIGEFTVQNTVIFGNVYQEFVFPKPSAVRYLKVVVGAGASGGHSYNTEWKAYGKYLSAEEVAEYAQEMAGRDINVLAAEFGGQLIAASDQKFSLLIDGIGGEVGKSLSVQPPKEGIFGFRDGKTALIKKVATPILEASDKNCKTIEIYASQTSPTSGYEKVGAFETTNLVFAGNPYQEYVFEEPVRAKYLKVKVIDTHGMYYCYFHEFQAIGTLED